MTRLQNAPPADRSPWTAQAPVPSTAGIGPGLALPPIEPPQGIADAEFEALARVAADLHASDVQILVRLIRRIAELEQLFGEEVALAMLEGAVAQSDPLSRLL